MGILHYFRERIEDFGVRIVETADGPEFEFRNRPQPDLTVGLDEVPISNSSAVLYQFPERK